MQFVVVIEQALVTVDWKLNSQPAELQKTVWRSVFLTI